MSRRSSTVVVCSIITLLLRPVVFPYLRARAWNVSIASNPDEQVHPGHHAAGWTLWGQAPGYDARGIYMLATHTPIYLLKIMYATITFVPMFIQLCIDKNRVNKVSDAALFDYCNNSTLVIMTKFEANNNLVFEMDPKYAPSNLGLVGDCDMSTLRLVFNENGSVIEASSKFGDVKGNARVGRNETVLMALFNIDANWLHPTIHVNAEKSALEIQSKRITELEPSAHIVSALHDGLLHGPIGPKAQGSPFFANTGSIEELVANCFSHPIPPHIMDERKHAMSKLYAFVVEGRKHVFRLVRKYKLDVNAECLFLNLIMHALDHTMVHENLSKLPLCSTDGTGSLWSYWGMHCHVRIWLTHWDNPLASDRVTSNLDKPFYRDLYVAMSKVNQHRADQMLVSCCF